MTGRGVPGSCSGGSISLPQPEWSSSPSATSNPLRKNWTSVPCPRSGELAVWNASCQTGNDLPRLDAHQLRGLADADDLVDRLGLRPWAEFKPGGSALRLIGMNSELASEMKRMIWREWSLIARLYGLELIEFGNTTEIRLPTRSRCEAIKTILHETPADIPIAYLGSNHLDEIGFHVAKYRAFTVMVQEPPIESSANLHLRSGAELFQFFQEWLIHCVTKPPLRDRSGSLLPHSLG